MLVLGRYPPLMLLWSVLLLTLSSVFEAGFDDYYRSYCSSVGLSFDGVISLRVWKTWLSIVFLFQSRRNEIVTIKNKLMARALWWYFICDRLCAALMKRNTNRNISNMSDK